MAKKNCIDGSHQLCTSSDSKLPECVCWCAECKDYFAEVRKAYGKNINLIRESIRKWA